MPKIDRETLETMALKACPAYLFYELGDGLESVPDDQLWDVVNGEIPKEEMQQI